MGGGEEDFREAEGVHVPTSLNARKIEQCVDELHQPLSISHHHQQRITG